MKREFLSIDLKDYYTLLAVWELQSGGWQLYTLARKCSAITHYYESPSTRLVFPTDVRLHKVWGGVQRRTYRRNSNLFEERRDFVLTLLKNSPGQTKESLAFTMDVSVATISNLLRLLERKGDIYQLKKDKNKRFYLINAPIAIGRNR